MEKKCWVSMKWECRKQFYALRYLACAYAALDLILLAMPEQWCRAATRNALWAVMTVNFLYAITAALLMVYPMLSMVPLHGENGGLLEQTAGLDGAMRLIWRIPANLCTALFLYANAMAGNLLMGKFAENHMTFFAMELELTAAETVLYFGLFSPCLYYCFYLIFSKRGREHKIWAFLAAEFFLGLMGNNTGIWGIAGFTAAVSALCIARGRRRISG